MYFFDIKSSHWNEVNQKLVRLWAIDLKKEYSFIERRIEFPFVLHSFGLFPTLGAGKISATVDFLSRVLWRDCERVSVDASKESSFETTPRNDESEQCRPISTLEPSTSITSYPPWNRVFSAFFPPSEKSSEQPTSNRYSLHRVTIESWMESFHSIRFLFRARRFFRPADHGFR